MFCVLQGNSEVSDNGSRFYVIYESLYGFTHQIVKILDYL